MQWAGVAVTIVKIEDMLERLVALPDFINLQNKAHADRITRLETRLERSTQHLVPLPGLLNELNNRYETLATSIVTLVGVCRDMGTFTKR